MDWCISERKNFKTPGIYKIVNLENNKVYVGSSMNLSKRYIQHTGALRRGSHHSKHLQMAYNKYGYNKFIFVVIEQCSIENLIKREQHHIDLLMSNNFKHGYNTGESASNPMTNRFHSEESKQKMRIKKIGTKISDETRAKFRERGVSDETKRKISNTLKNTRIGESNPSAKITENVARMIKLDCKSGDAICDIMKKYNVSRSIVRKIKSGLKWKWLDV